MNLITKDTEFNAFDDIVLTSAHSITRRKTPVIIQVLCDALNLLYLAKISNLYSESQLEKLTWAGFELACSSYRTAAPPVQLSSQQHDRFIRFNCTRDCRDNLTLYIRP